MPEQTDAEHGELDDLAAIKAEHAPYEDEDGGWWCNACSHYNYRGDCLPWRLADRAERAERERDEARRHVNTLVSELRVWQRKHIDKVAEVVRVEDERDGALAKVERLAGKVARVAHFCEASIKPGTYPTMVRLDGLMVALANQPELTAEPRHALTCDHLTGKGLRECKPGCPAYTADPYLRGADA